MDRRQNAMKYRKLRTAWSVACGLLCLLLIVLWVRSYWRWDSVDSPLPFRNGFHFDSVIGRTVLSISPPLPSGQTIKFVAYSNDRQDTDFSMFEFPGPLGGLFFRVDSNGLVVVLPYWLPVSFVVLCTVGPWITWRFSLRALLIGMAVVAALLGLVIWAAK
jgi:hypothetical protein